MSLISELFLIVREADEADYGRPVVRIHGGDKPRNIKWGDNVNISLDKKNWVTCKLEPAGETSTGKIYVGIHLRGLLNRNTLGVKIARAGTPCYFYIRRASSLKVLLYTTIAVIAIIAIAVLISLSVR